MIFLSNSPAFGFLFALIIQKFFQLGSKVKTWPWTSTWKWFDPFENFDLALSSSSACVEIEVSTFLQRKAKIWCAASWPSRKERGMVTFHNICWDFTIPMCDRLFLEASVFILFIHTFIVFIIFISYFIRKGIWGHLDIGVSITAMWQSTRASFITCLLQSLTVQRVRVTWWHVHLHGVRGPGLLCRSSRPRMYSVVCVCLFLWYKWKKGKYRTICIV